MNFKQFSEGYMARRPDMKASTLRSYTYILGKYLLPAFGGTELEVITPKVIYPFIDELVKHVTGSRANTVLQLLRSILGEAFQRELIKENPMTRIKRVKEKKTEIEPFSDAEIKAIFAHIPQEHILFFTILEKTGMRPNEALGLTWEDINLEAGTIHIQRGVVLGIEGLPKTQNSIRFVPILPALAEVLRPLKGSGKLFSNLIHAERIWQRACKKAGVKYRPPYFLRHSFASKALTKSVPITFVSKLLGHSDSNTTLKHYSRWIKSEEQEAKFLALLA